MGVGVANGLNDGTTDVPDLLEPVMSTVWCRPVTAKVNPVEAVLDDHYFLRKLQRCHGDMLDLGEGELIEYNRRLMEAEDETE